MIVIVTDSDSWSFVTSPGLGPRNSRPRANILRHHASRGGAALGRGNNEQHFVPDMNITEQLSLQTVLQTFQ